jgi:hypothetical protein
MNSRRPSTGGNTTHCINPQPGQPILLQAQRVDDTPLVIATPAPTDSGE